MTNPRRLLPTVLMTAAFFAGVQNVGAKEVFQTWKTASQDYALYVPDNPGGKPLPVVMFLHGAGNYPGPGVRTFWIVDALNAIEPCAVYLPHHPYQQADQDAGWGGTYDPALRGSLKEALAELDAKIREHRLDPDRQYAYGESMGGEAVFHLAAELPGRFAGLVPVAGYTKNTKASEMARTPIWMVYAAGDNLWKVSESNRDIYRALVWAGGKVKATEYAQGGDGMAAHAYAINAARADRSLLVWLLGQRKP